MVKDIERMTCGNCGSRIGEAEHRCRKCGRRPGDTLTREEPRLMTNGALAAQMQAAQPETLDGSTTVASVPPDLARATQRGLFQDNVIPFPPPPPKRRQAAPAGSKTASTGRAPARRAPGNQTSLDFLPSCPKPRTLSTTVDSKIYCEAPVAARLHRAIAASLDWAMVLIGYAVFLITYLLAGGEIVFTRSNVLILAGTFALTGFAYGIFWAVAGCETAGMQWTRLRLITFDGFRPDLKQRLLRFAGSCLSVCTVLGLIWSLGDEETLAWQDHISETFSTPLEFEKQVFRRK